MEEENWDRATSNYENLRLLYPYCVFLPKPLNGREHPADI